MQDFLTTILKITQDAEAIPRQYFRKGVDIVHKDDESPVTIADRATEEFIRDALAKAFPDHGIYGEEFGKTTGDSPYQWIIDPIDGTRSFITGFPLYGMLVALLQGDMPVLGIVRMPELAEVYSSDGNTTLLNGAQVCTASKTTDLNDAMIYINEANTLMRDEPDVFAQLNSVGRDRRFAYDCYPHALVAAGHVDACVDYGLKPYDYFPLIPIITAAGGVITDWRGAPLTMQSDGRVVCAATPQLHADLINILHQD